MRQDVEVFYVEINIFFVSRFCFYADLSEKIICLRYATQHDAFNTQL